MYRGTFDPLFVGADPRMEPLASSIELEDRGSGVTKKDMRDITLLDVKSTLNLLLTEDDHETLLGGRGGLPLGSAWVDDFAIAARS